MEVKIKVNGVDIDIHIEKAGDKGQSLLMVHGIPTNARLWRHVQARLQDRYATYAMDMVGYGQSSMPLDQFEHTLTNQAEAIKGVIEALGLKGKVVLVGHDHGGGASQIFASKYCDYISRLVLVNPVSFDYWPVLEVEAFNGLVGASDEVLTAAMQQAAANFGMLLRTGSYDKIAFTDQNVKQNYLQFWARGPGLTGFKSLVKVCSQPGSKDTLDIDYSKITCPTMVCWALHDAWMPKEAAVRIKQAMKGPTRLEFIERAGHYVPEDRPDVVAGFIDDFVTEWEGVPV
ncbi:MAG: alpha/beta hydrolase [Gammaproteobacteria bacterium]|nr:alpha/beta hydrolase [Gammaproteobacteria bacterium]